MAFNSINPFTEETIAIYEEDTVGSAIQKVKQGHQAFINWKERSLFERIEIISNALSILEENKLAWAQLMTAEMGKLTSNGIGEIDKCKWLIEYYAEHADYFLSSSDISTDYSKSYVRFEPLGTILCIMPWNFPFWQVFRAVIPALIAGNTVLLKHASNVQGCAHAITSIFENEAFPSHLLQNIALPGPSIKPLIGCNEIKGISLTGSTEVGKSVAIEAAKYLKKCVFELGGSDPYIILKDADLEKAVIACVSGRILNAGQSCIGAKRFIVVPEIREDFIRLFKAAFEQIKMGNPSDSTTGLGPMAALSFRNDLHKQVFDSIKKGAKCITGGELPAGKGVFYPPTILTHVKPDMPAYEDELFGPVASIIDAKDETDAIRIANDTSFGLGAAIFTEDIKQGESIVSSLDVGCCFINDYVRSDPRLPFGGIKESGYGRELSLWGIREFCNVKTVVVR